MDLQFLRFYTLFGVLVVLWLYGFLSLIVAARSLKIQRLRPKEGCDIIVESNAGKCFNKCEMENVSCNMAKRKTSKLRVLIFELILVICMLPNASLSESANTYKEYGVGWLIGKPAFSPDDKYLVLQTSKGIQFYELPSPESPRVSKAFLLEHREYRSGDGFCFTNDKKRLISVSRLIF